MTVVVTRNAPGRYRGFLSSCMCEIAPGVYTAPRMTVAVRDRIWSVLESWWEPGPDIAIVMTYPDDTHVGGQGVRCLGTPRTALIEHQGIYLAWRPLPDTNTNDGGTTR